jgi:plasmid maintenance system antidote protein VapI
MELMRSIGFTDADGIPWRQAFPEFAGDEKGTVLKDARLKEGLTQKLSAEKTGIPQRHISEMEHGRRPIGKTMAKRMAAALNASYQMLL